MEPVGTCLAHIKSPKPQPLETALPRVLEGGRGRAGGWGGETPCPPLFIFCYMFVHDGVRERDSSGWQGCVQVTHQFLVPLLRKTGNEGRKLNHDLSLRQLRSDYMQRYASKVSEGMALQLGCLELRYVVSSLLQGRYLCLPSWSAQLSSRVGSKNGYVRAGRGQVVTGKVRP